MTEFTILGCGDRNRVNIHGLSTAQTGADPGGKVSVSFNLTKHEAKELFNILGDHLEMFP